MHYKYKIALRFASNYLFKRKKTFPTFLIIGTQKGGTSSLFEYLMHHPQIAGSFIKEVQYFTGRYWVGQRGYSSFFPSISDTITQIGESTPYYLFSPEAPERVHALIPNVKIIALLREPVERAYSHYKHNTRRGHETRSFEECVAHDIKLAKGSGIDRATGEGAESFQHHSYVRRGLYAEQLERWYKLFPKENIKLLRAEDFFADPYKITAQTIDFLGLRPHAIETDTAHNQFAYDRKKRDQFPELIEFFKKPNEKLNQMTGINWDENSQTKQGGFA